MKAFVKRIFNKKGESLVESMAAILVLTFSSLIFLTMVSAASRINTTVKEEDAKFQETKGLLENRDASAGSTKNAVIRYGTAADSITDVLETISVDYYSNDSGMYTFYVQNGGGS